MKALVVVEYNITLKVLQISYYFHLPQLWIKLPDVYPVFQQIKLYKSRTASIRTFAVCLQFFPVLLKIKILTAFGASILFLVLNLEIEYLFLHFFV